MSERNFVPVKSDVIFRLFFADERNKGLLINFLKSIINLPDDEYQRIEFVDPSLLREYPGDKLGIIDVKLHTKSHKIVHIEIQISIPPQMRERIVFYSSKLITEQIGSGDEYEKIMKVISIIIMDETLIPDSPKYHHRFTLFDPKTDVELTDIFEINTLELKKIPEISDGTAMYDWARFIAAESEDELIMLAEENPNFNEAVIKYREFTAEERVRDLFERREKERRDIASFVKGARQEGLLEGRREGRKDAALNIARKALQKNIAIDEIIDITNLTRDEVEKLRESI